MLQLMRSSSSRNLFEDAYLNLSEFIYVEVTGGTAEKRLQFLNRAIPSNDIESYLPEIIYWAGVEQKFKLQVNTGLYAEALDPYEKLLSAPSGERFEQQHDGTIEQILTFSTQPDRQHSIKGVIGSGKSWRTKLFFSAIHRQHK